ncbi:hypothetical protein DFJ73DRAFT_932539 [Zopfochytrium polystomum]|nr:hypothetical protein DFJ73DRAFT_932539 [Zopfochytrium polystomum]
MSQMIQTPLLFRGIRFTNLGADAAVIGAVVAAHGRRAERPQFDFFLYPNPSVNNGGDNSDDRDNSDSDDDRDTGDEDNSNPTPPSANELRTNNRDLALLRGETLPRVASFTIAFHPHNNFQGNWTKGWDHTVGASSSPLFPRKRTTYCTRRYAAPGGGSCPKVVTACTRHVDGYQKFISVDLGDHFFLEARELRALRKVAQQQNPIGADSHSSSLSGELSNWKDSMPLLRGLVLVNFNVDMGQAAFLAAH